MLVRRSSSESDATCTIEARELANYRAPRTVGYYSAQRKLFPGEQALYTRYIRPGMRILDLGVGGGRTTRYLAENAKQYVGIDFSPEMVECCRKKHPHLEFYVMDAADLSAFPDHSFDCVVFSFNGIDDLYPVAKRAACFAECARILAPRGIFLLSSHHARGLIVGPNREVLAEVAGELAARLVGRGPLLHRIAQRLLISLGCVYVTIKRSVPFGYGRLTSKAFWNGYGYVQEHNESGTGMSLVYTSVPAKIVQELEGFGFRLLAMTPENPHFQRQSLPIWFNYAFQL